MQGFLENNSTTKTTAHPKKIALYFLGAILISFALILFLVIYYVAPFGSYNLNKSPLSEDLLPDNSDITKHPTNTNAPSNYLNPLSASGSATLDLAFINSIKTNLPTIDTQSIQEIMTRFKEIGVQINARNIQQSLTKNDTYMIQATALNDTPFSAKYDLVTDMISELNIDSKLYEVSISRIHFPEYLVKVKSDPDYTHDTIQAISKNVSNNEEILNLQQQNIKNEMSKWDIYVQPRNIQPIDESNNIFQIENAKVLNTLVNFHYNKKQNTASEILLIDDNITLADSLEPADILLEVENVLLQKERLTTGFNGIQKKLKGYGFIVPASALHYANDNLKTIRFEKMSSIIMQNGPQISGLFDSNQDIFIDVTWPSGATVSNIAITELQEEYAKQVILIELQKHGFSIETLEISGSVNTQLQLVDFVMGNFLIDCSFSPNTGLCGNILINKHPLNLQKEAVRLDQLATIMRGIVEVDAQKKARSDSQNTK